MRNITPPTESRITTVLNGVGNGMMVGALPFVAKNLYEAITSKTVHFPHQDKLIAFATVSGCVLGGVFGVSESKRMHDYRTAMNEEVNAIRQQVNANSQALETWANKLSQHTDTTAPHLGKVR